MVLQNCSLKTVLLIRICMWGRAYKDLWSHSKIKVEFIQYVFINGRYQRCRVIIEGTETREKYDYWCDVKPLSFFKCLTIGFKGTRVVLLLLHEVNLLWILVSCILTLDKEPYCFFTLFSSYIFTTLTRHFFLLLLPGCFGFILYIEHIK